MSAEANRRLSVLDALDRSLEANLARCGRLRQAILKRAIVAAHPGCSPRGLSGVVLTRDRRPVTGGTASGDRRDQVG